MTWFCLRTILFADKTGCVASWKTEGGANMQEKERQIVESIEKALPNLTESQKERLLGFGEGVAIIAQQQADSQQQ